MEVNIPDEFILHVSVYDIMNAKSFEKIDECVIALAIKRQIGGAIRVRVGEYGVHIDGVRYEFDNEFHRSDYDRVKETLQPFDVKLTKIK
jgi:hypothetical protein